MNYWDSSALILALHEPDLLDRIRRPDNITRIHSFAEIFCTLTKGVGYRYSPEDAARLVASLAANLVSIELAEAETLATLKNTRRLGVRGARVHDLMHMTAAEKARAEIILTLDRAGFSDFRNTIPVEHPMNVAW